MSATLTASEPFRTTEGHAESSSAFELFAPRAVRVLVSADQRAPLWLDYVLRRLNELSHRLEEPLPEPAPLPDPLALERALGELRSLLSDQTPSPSVVPTIEGGVQFVWHQAGWDIEIEVLPTDTEVWGRNRNLGTRWAGALDEVRGQVLDALRDIELAAIADRV